MKKLEGTCLLGETHGYQTPTGQYIVDTKAGRSVLDVLTAMLGLTVDMKPLEKQAKQMDEFTKKLAEVEKKVREELQRAAARDPSRYIT
jgi:proteasome assembly chaperone (PAC2) family protein